MEYPAMQHYPIQELKIVYRILHANLAKNTELMDGNFLEDLQKHLQKQAQSEGIDIGDHGAWDAWLGNKAVSCETRIGKRATLS